MVLSGVPRIGRYTSCRGGVYSGCFRKGLFHGPGEYIWPDGRKYAGMWQGGAMHGRGQFENFSNLDAASYFPIDLHKE